MEKGVKQINAVRDLIKFQNEGFKRVEMIHNPILNNPLNWQRHAIEEINQKNLANGK